MSRFCSAGKRLAHDIFYETDRRVARALVSEGLDQKTAQRVLEIVAEVIAEEDGSIYLAPVMVKHPAFSLKGAAQ